MISINETGFRPMDKKTAVSNSPGSFYVIDENERKRTDTKIIVEDRGYDGTSGENVYLLDLSGLKEPGIYHIESEEGDKSPSFKIEPFVYKTLKNALQKFFYFQRCGMELEEKYAGPYKRGACHKRLSKLYGEDEYFDIPKGWHDAGDFGRYVSAGAVAVAHLLYAYELFPEAFSDTVNIPETGNGMPDLLNECRYELDFISSMQDEDGGVHHKVTPMVFCGYIMPEEDNDEMLIFPVTSLSTADFAAVMCIASRVYEKYDPAFARDCIHQAYMAGRWLMEHEDNTDFHNPEGCITGEYTDSCDTDERMWAYAELMRTDYKVKNDRDRSIMAAASQRESRQDIYLRKFREAYDSYKESHPHADGRSIDDGFGWQDVSAFAAVAAVFDPENHAGPDIREEMTEMLTDRADAFLKMQDKGWPVSMCEEDFVWGSNMVVANRGDIMAVAALALDNKLLLDERGVEADDVQNVKVIELSYHDKKTIEKLSDDEKNDIKTRISSYDRAAKNQLNYILGMNAMSMSYVTGFGENSFRAPHNRVTVADGIDRPIPGEMSGGPCMLRADEEVRKHTDKNTPPQKCYMDEHTSYSTNEIAVYWNSSLLFLAGYIYTRQ